MTAAHRAAASALVGLLMGVLVALVGPWQLSALAGFDLAAAVFVLIAWIEASSLDARGTASRARMEDGSAGFVGTSVIVSSLAALVLEVIGLVEAERQSGTVKVLLVVLAVLAVVLGWLAVQSVYTFHYARLYFADDRRGIDFNSDDPPDFGDFIYFTITIAMTYQVSDTNISDSRIRRVVSRHALLSFVFGTAIIGTTINVMAGLIGQ